MLGHRFNVAAETLQQPVARAVRVGHRFQRRECLRGDDEKRFLGIEIEGCFDYVGAVDVGDEAEGQSAVAVMFQGLVRHDGAKVRAADPDINDGLDALSRVSFPMAVTDTPRKIGHFIEHGMDLRYDVLAVHRNRFALRRTKRDMQNGPIFGHIDLFAPEHGVDPRAQAGLLRQIDQELERFVRDAVFRIVQENASRLGGHPLSASRIIRKEVAQADLAHLLLMLF